MVGAGAGVDSSLEARFELARAQRGVSEVYSNLDQIDLPWSSIRHISRLPLGAGTSSSSVRRNVYLGLGWQDP